MALYLSHFFAASERDKMEFESSSHHEGCSFSTMSLAVIEFVSPWVSSLAFFLVTRLSCF